MDECTASCSSKGSKFVFAIVRNIPSHFHSKELRHFFTNFVESGRFNCFHFRHRPEVQTRQNNPKNSITLKDEKKNSPKRLCCIVRLSAENQEKLVSEYHQTHWTTEKNNELTLKCFIFRVKIGENEKNGGDNIISHSDLSSLIELKPPNLMPNGNVGTPSNYFFEKIRNCTLPSSVIRKLCLKAGKSTRRFGAVPMDYASDMNKYYESSEDKIIGNRTLDDNDGPDDDDDQCEEWERYEAHHDDVTEHERTKPRLFEDDAEVTWEKGGPGLVWYTDSFYWDQTEQASDCDWRWADDWDVDYSVYYDEFGGDFDAKQALQMRNEKMLTSAAISGSVFSKSDFKSSRKRNHSNDDSDVGNGGKFERHTKAIGSRYLRKFGWRPGQGIGISGHGKTHPVAVEMDEQKFGMARRSGFGYRGEKMQRRDFLKVPTERLITTAFDDKSVQDPKEILIRRNETTKLKHR